MARTKQEVRNFLNSLEGLKVNEKCGIYNGQCVSLIKALFEFLGVPNPYIGRGNAKDAGDNYVKQGIAANKSGWLNVCVNRDMGVVDGVNYGHMWLDLSGEMNIEQNGARALRTTKNTRPISQAQQIVNLDQYIKEEVEMVTPLAVAADVRFRLGRAPSAEENTRWVGKVTFDELDHALRASDEYKNRVVAVKNAKKLLNDFRSIDMRAY